MFAGRDLDSCADFSPALVPVRFGSIVFIVLDELKNFLRVFEVLQASGTFFDMILEFGFFSFAELAVKIEDDFFFRLFAFHSYPP
ncbi:hypothetical protein ES703_53542 [subsurface metagenome]